MAGSEENQLRQRDLQRSSEAYFYTNQGGVSKADGINDRNDFKAVNSALKLLGNYSSILHTRKIQLKITTFIYSFCSLLLGLDTKEIETAWDLVGGILHLG